MNPKKVNDDEILRYLENHTYDETQRKFGISRMTVARVKKRNKVIIMPNRINLAIVGIGNAASALIQGIEYYKSRADNIGFLHPTFAGYHISDIKITAAFDISERKVNKPLNEALKENELDLITNLENQNTIVFMGEIKDGVIKETEKLINPSAEKAVNIAKILEETDTEILLCLLPSGADEAVLHYAEQALKANCAFINATPTNIATDKNLTQKFHDKGLPLIGDDLQDQFGATIVHKLILKQMIDQGVKVKESYALDVGGGLESLNTIHRTRHTKREIKTKSVSASLNIDAPIVAGTSDFVPHLGNSRNSMLWLRGKGFLGSEIVMDIKIQTEDGPNGGAILADVIRATKIALQRGAVGAINEISAYGFKNPPRRIDSPQKAIENLANFIMGVR
ncbi:MAG: inositol-3-phosphate synthase [Candidatus Lokiarchaeota archaeon]|nr:inositol-3-phosphate synthase [Candidatus Lokiarchaeota archaeon]MBD3339756.1 inositol-3-phosphate synthase [Candidatus Lokiarchaeota archaeon]